MNNNNLNNGWGEWSNFVIRQLEDLNRNYENINHKIDLVKNIVHDEISDIKNEITKVKTMQYSLDEMKVWKKTYEDEAILKTVLDLKNWKNELESHLSLKQLHQLVEDVNKLKAFKIQATTIFFVVQSLVLFLSKFI